MHDEIGFVGGVEHDYHKGDGGVDSGGVAQSEYGLVGGIGEGDFLAIREAYGGIALEADLNLGVKAFGEAGGYLSEGGREKCCECEERAFGEKHSSCLVCGARRMFEVVVRRLREMKEENS